MAALTEATDNVVDAPAPPLDTKKRASDAAPSPAAKRPSLGPSDGRFAGGALASLARFLSDSGGAGASTTLSVASARAAMGLRAAREAKKCGGENFVGDRSARRRA